MKNAFKVLGVLSAIILFGFIGKIIFFGTTAVHNTLDTPREINNRIMNGDNAIKEYEWFKQQEADIRRLHTQETNHIAALERFKESLPADKTQWNSFDRDDYQKLSANITAQQDMVNRAIENYNAHSSMVTKNIFKDNLPSNLSRSFYAQKDLIFQ